MKTAQVLVFRGIDTQYTYLIPEDEQDDFDCGDHVEIPLGRSKAFGLITSIQSLEDSPIKKLKILSKERIRNPA